ncbi:Tripartite-type tricarboxylate transporter, receptor component TctC [Variovorax sp. OK605]|jgi:tripartite-type tricarboxylate transporter receptor subunit TctC|uniref:Bug family tripartite tricarboxylate transporter substrate binding protein n=1 Tax=unclassified Variovorax TaxID=663243 RepID=UPI0008BA0D55|nr:MULTISPECIES: tripartite tricarboxylate transporter substrate binding protein [unclassified Variovorax]SEK12373.1 Tripartite-type tricarboxylate transporter, receptor component TctC [Variovorax sp. OK202]SFD81275.1 Tripartite-type tricarboxylate transporter, receptor component TctC [Variovorax sp. OK212]SFP59253.1 Tripartite-type tricarboxylate transporter, receptor component TctC [Variovorax sp. OK605]
MKKFATLVFAVCGSCIAALGTAPALAQPKADYPHKPIVLVVPQPAGGAADQFARPFGQALSQRLGQPVIIDNRPGANGNIAAAYVARNQPADGYTVFFGSVSTLAVNPHLYKATGFDALKDFQPITLTNQTPNVLVVGAGTPYKTVADVVAAAKKAPGTLSFGSAGNGNTMHLTGLQFEARTGTQLIHVPYKGGPAALNDVMGGQIPMMFHNLSAVLGQEKGGRVRVLAVADTQRSKLLPNVPTMAEAGAPGVVQLAWSGMLVRAGTPAPVVERLHKEMAGILADPAFRKPLEEQGFDVLSSTPQAFTERLKADHATMGEVIKAGNVQID